MTPDRLRRLLDLLDWSQRGLAVILDRDDRLVRRWASGKTDIPLDVDAWLVQAEQLADAIPASDRPQRDEAEVVEDHRGLLPFENLDDDDTDD